MRSHVIVAVVALGAVALVVELALRGSVSRAVPVEPVQGTRLPQAPIVAKEDVSAQPADPAAVTAGAPAATAEPARQLVAVRTLCMLGGYVRTQGDGQRPVSGAYVGLYLPALEDDSPATEFGQWGGKPGQYAKRRQLQTWTYTDDEGQFVFDELAAGTYVLRAERGPLLVAVTAPQTLSAGEARAGLQLDLPEGGGLSGRILVPDGVTFDTWRVALQRSETETVPPSFVENLRDDKLDGGIDDDGTFHLGPAAAGLHRVWLMATRAGSRRSAQSTMPIGDAKIVAGEDVEQVFDLRGGFPGSLQVSVRAPALEQSGYDLRHAYTSVIATPQFEGEGVRQMYSTCLVSGTTIVGPLRPGPWTLSVRSNFEPWSFATGRTEIVGPGRMDDVTIEVPLFQGRLTCLDAESGASLKKEFVQLSQAGSRTSYGFTTDGTGVIQLILARGSYSAARVNVEGDAWDEALGETFEWAQDGPHPSAVKLLRPVTAPR